MEKEPDVDSQGNQFHSCQSNDGEALQDGEETKEQYVEDDNDDDWEDENKTKRSKRRTRRGQQANLDNFTSLTNAMGGNNGGNVQTQTFTDEFGNVTQVQVETVVQEVNVN